MHHTGTYVTIRCVNFLSTLPIYEDRAGEAIATALDITNTLVQDLIVEVRENMSDIFSLVDSVALLDMLG